VAILPIPPPSHTHTLSHTHTHSHTHSHTHTLTPKPPTQVEADIRPFRGLLLGLFFVSVGSSINMDVLRDEWEVVAWMLVGLVSFKAAVNIALGPLFGLSRWGLVGGKGGGEGDVVVRVLVLRRSAKRTSYALL